ATTTYGPRIISRKVVNAASSAPLTANSGIAQGSYFAVYGCGLGDMTNRSASLPYLNDINGASVTVTPAGGSAVKAFLTFARADQINGILPSTVPVGDATVTVTVNGATSPAEKIRVVRTSFGLVSTGYPIGTAAVINLNTTLLYPIFTNA